MPNIGSIKPLPPAAGPVADRSPCLRGSAGASFPSSDVAGPVMAADMGAPVFIAHPPTLENFVQVFVRNDFLTCTSNPVIV